MIESFVEDLLHLFTPEMVSHTEVRGEDWFSFELVSLPEIVASHEQDREAQNANNEQMRLYHRFSIHSPIFPRSPLLQKMPITRIRIVGIQPQNM